MSKGITHSCANVWRAIARAGNWASRDSIVHDWSGVYTPAEVDEHLETLVSGGFLELGESKRDGDMFAYTDKCHQLPGETLLPAARDLDFKGSVAEPRRNDVMNSVYRPQTENFRPGAFDHAQCPSMHMGRRHAFGSIR